MHCHDLVIHQKTKIAQWLLKDLDHKITQFQIFIINQRKQNEYDMAHIGNMDEMPMFFYVVSNTTINKKACHLNNTTYQLSHIHDHLYVGHLPNYLPA